MAHLERVVLRWEVLIRCAGDQDRPGLNSCERALEFTPVLVISADIAPSGAQRAVGLVAEPGVIGLMAIRLLAMAGFRGRSVR